MRAVIYAWYSPHQQSEAAVANRMEEALKSSGRPPIYRPPSLLT
jgi:hypothetical protein